MQHYKDNKLKTPIHCFQNISKMLENDLKVPLQVQPSPPPACTCRRGLLGTVFGDDTRAHRVGVASGCAWIWSEQSDGAGEASHGSLGAQRERRSRERGRVRRHSGWEACRWLITTHICSPHFLLYFLCPKRAQCQNLNSLLAPVYRLHSLILSQTPKGSTFMVLL